MTEDKMPTHQEILNMAKEWLKTKSNREWIKAFKRLEKEEKENNDRI
jgi:hypothetical protein